MPTIETRYLIAGNRLRTFPIGKRTVINGKPKRHASWNTSFRVLTVCVFAVCVRFAEPSACICIQTVLRFSSYSFFAFRQSQYKIAPLVKKLNRFENWLPVKCDFAFVIFLIFFFWSVWTSGFSLFRQSIFAVELQNEWKSPLNRHKTIQLRSRTNKNFID